MHRRFNVAAKSNRAWDTQGIGQVLHKSRIKDIFFAAGLVIEMNDSKGQISPFPKEPEQCNAVGPPADADRPGAGRDIGDCGEERFVGHVGMIRWEGRWGMFCAP